jgi:hypothetical protein
MLSSHGEGVGEERVSTGLNVLERVPTGPNGFQQVWGGGGGKVNDLFIVSHPLQKKNLTKHGFIINNIYYIILIIIYLVFNCVFIVFNEIIQKHLETFLLCPC